MLSKSDKVSDGLRHPRSLTLDLLERRDADTCSRGRSGGSRTERSCARICPQCAAEGDTRRCTLRVRSFACARL